MVIKNRKVTLLIIGNGKQFLSFNEQGNGSDWLILRQI